MSNTTTVIDETTETVESAKPKTKRRMLTEQEQIAKLEAELAARREKIVERKRKAVAVAQDKYDKLVQRSSMLDYEIDVVRSELDEAKDALREAQGE